MICLAFEQETTILRKEKVVIEVFSEVGVLGIRLVGVVGVERIIELSITDSIDFGRIGN